MGNRLKLFFGKNPYDYENTGHLFFDAVIENIRFHEKNCEKYSEILKSQNFEIESLKNEEDLYKIPPLPTLYFKRNRIFSMEEKKLIVKAYSSGTKGSQSKIGLDKNTLICGILMMVRFFSYYKIISLRPTNYIVLGYEPSSHTDMGAVKTAYGTTKFAPALHREYALKDTGDDYKINIQGIQNALYKYAKQKMPVRFVGFPAYMYFLAKELKDRGIKLKLNKHSKILMGGGWKQFSSEEIDRDEFYKLIYDTLGIEKKNCFEFFSAVEHPLPYVKCEMGHFHVPKYSRVIIRDVKTLEPVTCGTAGLLSFVSPLVISMPLVSVVTDDIAVKHSGEKCGCGNTAPYFDVIGRAGVAQIKTCTAGAAELLGGAKE